MEGTFTDRVAEYHILNAQLMSKAMALLDSADDIMADKGPKHHHPHIKHELPETTLEYHHPIIGGDDPPKSPNRFSFPIRYDDDKCRPLSGDDDESSSVPVNSSFSENDDKLLASSARHRDAEVVDENATIVDRLLKTKITLQQKSVTAAEKCNTVEAHLHQLTVQVHDLRQRLNKKIQECEEHTKTNQALQENKMKLMGQINNLKSQSIKKDGRIGALNSRIQVLESESKSIKSERDALVRSAKEKANEVSTTEVRLARALKEIIALKEALEACKSEEKESRESARKQLEKLTNAAKIAEKREKTLLTALKKQALLIDNLKKQVNYLTSRDEVDASEKQLDSILKWEHK